MMRGKCKVLGCTSQSQRAFKFPVGNKRLLLWLSASGNKNLLEVSPEKLSHNVICGHHFEEKYILAKKLSTSAIPTLHLPDCIDASQYLKAWDKENQPPTQMDLLPTIEAPSANTQIHNRPDHDYYHTSDKSLYPLTCNDVLEETQNNDVGRERCNPDSIDMVSSSGSFDGSRFSSAKSVSQDSILTSGKFTRERVFSFALNYLFAITFV